MAGSSVVSLDRDCPADVPSIFAGDSWSLADGANGTGDCKAKGTLIVTANRVAAISAVCGRLRLPHQVAAFVRGCRDGGSFPSKRARAAAIAASRSFGAGGGEFGRIALMSSSPVMRAPGQTASGDGLCDLYGNPH